MMVSHEIRAFDSQVMFITASRLCINWLYIYLVQKELLIFHKDIGMWKNTIDLLFCLSGTIKQISVSSNVKVRMWTACNLTAFIFTQSHWSSGSTICFSSWGTRVQSPGEYLCETGILLLALSRYIGDSNVDDLCGLIWGGLHPKPSLGHRTNNVIIPLDRSLSRFHARCRSSFWLH